MDRAINTQVQAIITQSQDMKAQANMEVVPRANQHIGSMASRLRVFTMMSSPTFYGSKINELTIIKKVELPTFQLKDVAQTLY